MQCTNHILSVSQVIFEHEGVFIHAGSEEDGVEPDLLISGTLRIVDKVIVWFISSTSNSTESSFGIIVTI